MSESYFRRRGRRVMICIRGECAPPQKGKNLEARLNDLIQEYGLDDVEHPQYVRCTVTNCLAVCEDGPVMMVQPEGVRYHRVDEAALEQIFHEHLRNNQPVEALVRPIAPPTALDDSRRTRPRRGNKRRR